MVSKKMVGTKSKMRSANANRHESSHENSPLAPQAGTARGATGLTARGKSGIGILPVVRSPEISQAGSLRHDSCHGLLGSGMRSDETAAMQAVPQRLGIRVRRAMFALRRLLMSRLAPLGFTHEQYVLLLFLGEQDGITQIELAQRSFTNPNTVTAILNRLEADGLVKRVDHEDDGRAFCVHITKRGAAAREQLMGIANEITELVLGAIPAAQRQALLGALDTLAETAETALRSCRKAR